MGPMSLILEVLRCNFHLISARETSSSYRLSLPCLGAFCGEIPSVQAIWPFQCLWVGEERFRFAGAKMIPRLSCSL